MIINTKIEQIARHVQESMPKSIRKFSEDIDKKIKGIMKDQLMRLNLISCEEFDIQKQLLLRLREKLSCLEQRLNELENRNNTTVEEDKPESSIPQVEE